MKLIKQLSEQIEDEVSGALEYSREAVEFKYSRPSLADMYYRMACAEKEHADMLHEHVVKIIEEVKRDKKDAVPQFMLDKWEKQHKEIIEKMAEAKVYLSLYK
jgi:hypothetical protein